MDLKVAEEGNFRSSETAAAASENLVDLGYQRRVNINTETGLSVLSSHLIEEEIYVK
jgi:hypothetical protein